MRTIEPHVSIKHRQLCSKNVQSSFICACDLSSASTMWVTIFIVLMQVGVSVAITQVVLSAVHDCFYCKIKVSVSVIAM